MLFLHASFSVLKEVKDRKKCRHFYCFMCFILYDFNNNNIRGSGRSPSGLHGRAPVQGVVGGGANQLKLKAFLSFDVQTPKETANLHSRCQTMISSLQSNFKQYIKLNVYSMSEVLALYHATFPDVLSDWL